LYLDNKNSHEEKGIGKWLLAIGIMIAALPAINMLSYWNQQMDLPAFLAPMEAWMKTKEETAKILTEQFMSVNTVGGLVANLLLMAVLPALAEELTFRGVLQRVFEARGERREAKGERKPHLAIWCTAILFSAIHLQFYGFVPRMLMGALFGYALAWSGTLWLPILMHMTNNAMAVLISYASIKAGWDMETVDSIGTNDTLWLGIVSLLITCIGIYAFRRSTTMSKASSRMSSGS
jgi:membrane protease YdiL (CAAX protease family)